jgi:hypothetical protein
MAGGGRRERLIPLVRFDDLRRSTAPRKRLVCASARAKDDHSRQIYWQRNPFCLG